MNRPSTAETVAIVGGGVIGLSLAWELARRERRVQVFERGELGREASWAGAGMLPAAPEQTQDAMEQLMAVSRKLHSRWSRELLEETGIDNELQENGALYIARTTGEQAALRAWQRDCERQSLDCQWLDGAAVRSLEPALEDAALRGACRLPGEAQLRNPRHLQALAAACRNRGVDLCTHREVAHVDLASGRLLLRNGATIHPSQTVLTAGPWTRDLLKDHPKPPDIYPVRGQMVLFRSDHRLLTHTINDGPRYLVPRKDGRLLAGSTEEEVGFDKRNTPAGVDALKQFAIGLLPSLQDAEVETTWAGLRPAAFDTFPYLGRLPSSDRVFVAAGHFRHGLNLSTGTAVAMAQLLCGEQPSLCLERFHVGR